MTPIYEPELNFLPHACECGAAFDTRESLDLHRRETCWQRPGSRPEPPLFFPPSGDWDSGRRA